MGWHFLKEYNIQNNGWLSKTCFIARGIRHGFPISALSYIFVAEVLAIKINVNTGININANKIKEKVSSMHMDDLTINVKDDISY